MASCDRLLAALSEEPCAFCQSIPCVGDDCPSNWDDGARGACIECGDPLHLWETGGVCERCEWHELRDDGSADGEESEWEPEFWED